MLSGINTQVIHFLTVINIAVIMAISIIVILSCGGPSDELVEMRRLVKKAATGMKGSKLRGL